MMNDPELVARWETLCLVTVALFSCSGWFIMQMPRDQRRTLFIFPAFLSVVVGGSLAVYGIENFSAWKVAAAALLPLALAKVSARVVPVWLMTTLSYVTMIAAVVCADYLLEASAFRP